MEKPKKKDEPHYLCDTLYCGGVCHYRTTAQVKGHLTFCPSEIIYPSLKKKKKGEVK